MSRVDDIETVSGRDDGTPRTRTEALIHLLGDDDTGIRSQAWGHLEKLGKEGLAKSVVFVATGDEAPILRLLE